MGENHNKVAQHSHLYVGQHHTLGRRHNQNMVGPDNKPVEGKVAESVVLLAPVVCRLAQTLIYFPVHLAQQLVTAAQAWLPVPKVRVAPSVV